MNVKDDMQEMFDKLKRERDELRVKVNLLQKEARDEWEDLDDSWHKLRVKVNEVSDAGERASSDVYEAIKLLGSEVKEGFARIRRSL